MNIISLDTATQVQAQASEAAAIELRLLAEFEVAFVGGGENVAGFF